MPVAGGKVTVSMRSLILPQLRRVAVLGCELPWWLWSREETQGGATSHAQGVSVICRLSSCRSTLLPPPTDQARQLRSSESRVWLTDSAPTKASLQSFSGAGPCLAHLAGPWHLIGAASDVSELDTANDAAHSNRQGRPPCMPVRGLLGHSEKHQGCWLPLSGVFRQTPLERCLTWILKEAWDCR